MTLCGAVKYKNDVINRKFNSEYKKEFIANELDTPRISNLFHDKNKNHIVFNRNNIKKFYRSKSSDKANDTTLTSCKNLTSTQNLSI